MSELAAVLKVHAPMAGILRRLDAVPDEAFSQRLLGDGFAIDPMDEVVRAPCAGTVLNVADTGHAVTIRSPDGVEILIHIGIDTVQLAGRGFSPQIKAGQVVELGQLLVEFDLDMLSREAKSVLTLVVVLSDHHFAHEIFDKQRVAAGDILLKLRAVRPAPVDPVGHSEEVAVKTMNVVLGLPHGLHARPSGKIAELARTFDGEMTVSRGEQSAEATSVTALMALGTQLGSEIQITAVGREPEAILGAMADLLNRIASAELEDIKGQAGAVAKSGLGANSPGMPDFAICGVIASPGLAAGRVIKLDAAEITVVEQGTGADAETQRLDKAIEQSDLALRAIATSSNAVAAAIAEAHQAILHDPAIHRAALAYIHQGSSAEYAWRQAIGFQETSLLATNNAHLQGRIIDLRDVERRILACLTGADIKTAAEHMAGAILVGEDIEPSTVIGLASQSIAGICTARGGATSHAAILAASYSIPMLVAAGPSILALEDGEFVVLDAERGFLDPAPPADAQGVIADRLALLSDKALSVKAAAQQECRLADGTRIEVFANLGSEADAHNALINGAEGCGLLRTEFIFSECETLPDEDFQAERYRAIAAALGDRPLIIRTLDIGGDKPLAYLPFPNEPNPALGQRGIRFSLAETEILRTQLRALLHGVPGTQLRIMLPMVVEVDEIHQVRALFETECSDLGLSSDVQIGIMVETPAAALLADQLALHADFLSIGSNDLSQYVLAMDRGNAALATRVDAYHPAVLRAIDLTARGAAQSGCWLGICGSLASDYRAAPLLVGLGCHELSAVPHAVPRIKEALRPWTIERCRALAENALSLNSAAQVRSLIESEMP